MKVTGQRSELSETMINCCPQVVSVKCQQYLICVNIACNKNVSPYTGERTVTCTNASCRRKMLVWKMESMPTSCEKTIWKDLSRCVGRSYVGNGPVWFCIQQEKIIIRYTILLLKLFGILFRELICSFLLLICFNYLWSYLFLLIKTQFCITKLWAIPRALKNRLKIPTNKKYVYIYRKRFESLYYFRSRNFHEFREFGRLRREKFYIDRFAKVYAREIFQIFFLQTCWMPLIMR